MCQDAVTRGQGARVRADALRIARGRRLPSDYDFCAGMLSGATWEGAWPRRGRDMAHRWSLSAKRCMPLHGKAKGFCTRALCIHVKVSFYSEYVRAQI